MANNAQIAADVMAAIGGKENVNGLTHCMTRLRFNLKDDSVVKDDIINGINGVIKVIRAGGQVQVVIGTNVDKVYDEIGKLGGLGNQTAVDENQADKPKEKFTVKGFMNGMLGGLTGSLTPVLPVIIVAGIFKMVAVLFGPKNLGWLTDKNQLYILCNLVNDSAYYFLPFFVAYSASKKFKANPVFAMMLSAVMLHPNMLKIVSAGESFNVYGLVPMKLVNYTQAVIPIILITWALSYVERWVKKIMPDMIRTIGVPVLVMVIMIPLALCVLGPVCYAIMEGVANGIIWMNNTIGLPTMVVVAAFWVIMVTFGVHMPIMMALLPVWMQMGYDAIVSPATIASMFAGIGVELAYALRANTKENRSLGWSCFVTNVTANVSEPAIYGIFLRDKKAMAWVMVGAAAGAATMGILGAKVVLFSGVGFPFLNFLRFGEYAVQGTIGMVVAFVVSLGMGMFFGFNKETESV